MPHLNILHGCLKFCGFWETDEKFERRNVIKMRITLGIFVYYCIGMGLYLIKIIPDETVRINEKFESLFAVSGFFNMVFNCFAMFHQRIKIKKLFMELENFDGNDHNIKNLPKIAKLMNLLGFLMVAYCVLASFIISLGPVYQYENCLRQEEILRSLNRTSIICGFGVKVFYPYRVSSGILYFVHVTIENYSICYACAGGCMIAPCTMASFEFVILRIQLLKEMLKKVFENTHEIDDTRKMQKWKINFTACIIFHIKIINLAEMINNCFSTVTSPALVNYSICIGTTLMACLSGYSTISLLNLCGWVLGVYLMCLTGQRIQTQSLSIADAVYDMEWYKANPKLRKDIYFMMIRAQKPLLFQCGILGNFHFITFKNIMSTAYRFTTLKTGFSG